MGSARHPFVLRSTRNKLLVGGDTFVLKGQNAAEARLGKQTCSYRIFLESGGKGPLEYMDGHESAKREHGKAQSRLKATRLGSTT